MDTRAAKGTDVENKATARRLYEAFNEAFRAADPDVLDKVIATNVLDHDPTPGQGYGLEGVKRFVSMFRAAFPDIRNTVEDLVAEGDTVVARVVLRGTHRGRFMGIAPTGEQVAMRGIEIIRYSDGKATERWGRFDLLGLLQQLGAVPAPEQAAEANSGAKPTASGPGRAPALGRD